MNIQHLGLIPDGNRRWAKENGVCLEYAYSEFAKKIVEITEKCNDIGIRELSIYLLSKDNLLRNPDELLPVIHGVTSLLREMVTIAKKSNLIVRIHGDKSHGYRELNQYEAVLRESTSGNSGMIVNLLLGYSPFDEIAEALLYHDRISLESLSVSTRVDLVFRTAGKPVRLSTFLPLQSGYANIEVSDHFFLDLDPSELETVIHKYDSIIPRYGR